MGCWESVSIEQNIYIIYCKILLFLKYKVHALHTIILSQVKIKMFILYPSLVQSVSACMSTRHLSGGAERTGGALAWGARARSGPQCSRAAHAALRAHCAGRPLPAADLLLTAGPALLVDDTLLLLGIYNTLITIHIPILYMSYKEIVICMSQATFTFVVIPLCGILI